MPDRLAPAPMRYSIFSVNDHYLDRGRSIARFYREVTDQCVLAEELGYDTFFVAEHHFDSYGVFPNPAIMLAAWSQRTSRIKLGAATAMLIFRNPLNVAEDYAMLDQISGGRVVLGVGSGYLAHEFKGFKVDAKQKRERFDEAHAILKRALAGERITVHGKFHDIDDVAVNVTPLQEPFPPAIIAVLRFEAVYHVGRQGARMMIIPYVSVDHFDNVVTIVDEYRRGRADAGLETGDDDLLTAFHTHVAGSDEEARENAAEAFNLYIATRKYAKRQRYDDALQHGLALFGSVETVTEKIVRLYDMGVRHVMTLHNFGLLDHSKVCRSMELVAREVMPRVAERVARRSAA